MKETLNANLKLNQLKSDLISYGNYLKMIDNINEELFRIREDIEDCYTASGIAYDKPISNKSVQYSRINSLLADESELITQRKNMMKRLDELGLRDAVNDLEDEEKEMIELKYFCNYSFQHISLTTPNSIKRIRTITDRSLSKLFNKVHTCPWNISYNGEGEKDNSLHDNVFW